MRSTLVWFPATRADTHTQSENVKYFLLKTPHFKHYMSLRIKSLPFFFEELAS